MTTRRSFLRTAAGLLIPAVVPIEPVRKAWWFLGGVNPVAAVVPEVFGNFIDLATGGIESVPMRLIDGVYRANWTAQKAGRFVFSSVTTVTDNRSFTRDCSTGPRTHWLSDSDVLSVSVSARLT